MQLLTRKGRGVRNCSQYFNLFLFFLKNSPPCMHLSRRKGIRVRNRMHPLQRASPVSFGWFIDQQLLIHICFLDKNIMNIKKYYYENRAGSVSFGWFIEQQLLIHICSLDKNIMNINCMENIANRKETNMPPFSSSAVSQVSVSPDV